MMDYLKAFIVGGGICVLGQILIDKTKLTSARILVLFVVVLSEDIHERDGSVFHIVDDAFDL